MLSSPKSKQTKNKSPEIKVSRPTHFHSSGPAIEALPLFWAVGSSQLILTHGLSLHATDCVPSSQGAIPGHCALPPGFPWNSAWDNWLSSQRPTTFSFSWLSPRCVHHTGSPLLDPLSGLRLTDLCRKRKMLPCVLKIKFLIFFFIFN